MVPVSRGEQSLVTQREREQQRPAFTSMRDRGIEGRSTQHRKRQARDGDGLGGARFVRVMPIQCASPLPSLFNCPAGLTWSLLSVSTSCVPTVERAEDGGGFCGHVSSVSHGSASGSASLNRILERAQRAETNTGDKDEPYLTSHHPPSNSIGYDRLEQHLHSLSESAGESCAGR